MPADVGEKFPGILVRFWEDPSLRMLNDPSVTEPYSRFGKPNFSGSSSKAFLIAFHSADVNCCAAMLSLLLLPSALLRVSCTKDTTASGGCQRSVRAGMGASRLRAGIGHPGRESRHSIPMGESILDHTFWLIVTLLSSIS